MGATPTSRAPGSVRLLTFNIRQGGRSRMDAITDTILRHEPDIAVITEFRASTATVLPERLASRGLSCQASSGMQGSQNGIFLASRLPFRVVQDAGHACPSPRHYLDAKFEHFRLGAIYRPMSKVDFEAYYDWLDHLLYARRLRRFILMGDMNWLEMGDGGREQPGVVEAICELGYVDAWRRLNPTAREYSWTNHNGTRTRVDYTFLSKRVAGRLANAWYAHDEREAEVSDHCPLIVDLTEPDRISRVVGAVRRFGSNGARAGGA